MAYINQYQVGTTTYDIKDGTSKQLTLQVSGTPSALSSACWWDTEAKYMYYLDIAASGVTETMLVDNFVATDTLLAELGPVVATGANKITVYAADATALSGTIKLVAREA